MTFSEDASNYIGASCNRNSVFLIPWSPWSPEMEKYVDSNWILFKSIIFLFFFFKDFELILE